MNEPIEKLVAEYGEQDIKHTADIALRYVESMEDCQIRALLYLMAMHINGYEREKL